FMSLSAVSHYIVLLHHPLGVEEGPVDGDAITSDTKETFALVKVHRQNFIFEAFVDRIGARLQTIAGFGNSFETVFGVFDLPAGNVLNVAFNPPTVERA